MTTVLVHGNPETPAVWDLLVESLTALGVPEPVRLAPPGFGAPVPDGWGCSVGEYRDWLVAELEGFDDPVDLVGHDWGGGHVLNAVMARPELVRSWCSDIPGVFDPDYVWHELAQVWQQPGAGEAAVAAMAAAPAAARASGMTGRGMAPVVAERIAAGFDDVMGDCILRLYRSAAQPVMAQLGAGLEAAAARPGLAVLPTEDHMVGTDEQRYRAAARAGARVEVLDGLGHWWMTEDPDRAARMLVDFWRSV
ncbi:alpha/beta fold hydrolase [Pseudonocardia sp. MH-G8]|uniref:alpha/beta fold hydrolase n=1 Tax=Pseudonocardia sp. MH-G8 TaxID=1854588 RepID=UPI000BA1833A|nr:alpha/beta hydrolase [Pseudonocardia sp. MH-G8]OZM83937.1 alpha/beta hydrolase [Pseudonocardia sp. MH-G8]